MPSETVPPCTLTLNWHSVNPLKVHPPAAVDGPRERGVGGEEEQDEDKKQKKKKIKKNRVKEKNWKTDQQEPESKISKMSRSRVFQQEGYYQ